MDNRELAELICNTISDGYDDEEMKENAIDLLEKEMVEASENNVTLLAIKSALLRLCRRAEELEEKYHEMLEENYYDM